jgi:hypothetical protein
MYRKLWAVATAAPRRLVLLAMVVVAVAVPLAQAQAQAAHQTRSPQPCRTGDAPLPDGASTSKTSAAGLAARGWDSWSAGTAGRCRS